MRYKLLFIFFLAINVLYTSSQIVSSNGWYFPKTPMSNIFGYPFIDVTTSGKEATISNGTVLTVDSAVDLAVNSGFNYSKIFEQSWREIILGSLYKKNKNIELKVESWRAKRWIFNRNRFHEFDRDAFYVVEGISADSLRITVKIFKKKSSDSKIVEDIIKTFAAGHTAAFKVLETLSKSKPDSLKGFFQFLKKDSTEFVIDINRSDVLYALKFGKVQEDGGQFFQVQTYYYDTKEIPLGQNVKKTIMNYTYTPPNAGAVNVYVDLVRKRVDDTSPSLLIYNLSAKDTIELRKGDDIGNGLLHFEGEAIYKRNYAGDKTLQVFFCYDFAYDPKRNVIIVKGYDQSIKEYLNCIYKIDARFNIYP